MKIQRISIMDPSSSAPTVEMTIADHHLIDEATRMVVASVQLEHAEGSMEGFQLAALRELRTSLDELYSEMLRKQPGVTRDPREPSALVD